MRCELPWPPSSDEQWILSTATSTVVNSTMMTELNGVYAHESQSGSVVPMHSEQRNTKQLSVLYVHPDGGGRCLPRRR